MKKDKKIKIRIPVAPPTEIHKDKSKYDRDQNKEAIEEGLEDLQDTENTSKIKDKEKC